jgi:hypothetical protein
VATIRFLNEQELAKSNKLGRRDIRYSAQITEPEIDRLSEEIVIWAEETKAVRWTTLLVDFNIPPNTFKHWLEKYPHLDAAYKIVKLIFAERREEGAFTGKYNAAFVRDMHALYCDDYRELLKEMAAMKRESGTGNTVVNVSMSKMPETDIVPEKALGGTSGDD